MSANELANVRVMDPLIADALVQEKQRQQNQIELIASENIVSRAVLEAAFVVFGSTSGLPDRPERL